MPAAPLPPHLKAQQAIQNLQTKFGEAWCRTPAPPPPAFTPCAEPHPRAMVPWWAWTAAAPGWRQWSRTYFERNHFFRPGDPGGPTVGPHFAWAVLPSGYTK
jgi:hypothetical protein